MACNCCGCLLLAVLGGFVDLWLGGLGWCFDLLVVFTLLVIAWLVYSLTLSAGLVEVDDCGLVLWGFGDY